MNLEFVTLQKYDSRNLIVVHPTILVNISVSLSQTPLDGYVGFDTVLEQQRKKFLKKGFEFNLMVVGKFSKGF